MKVRLFPEVRAALVRAADSVAESSASVSDTARAGAAVLTVAACVAIAYMLYQWATR